MLLKLIRATGFRRFANLVSPAFFDVVPAGPMLRQGRALFLNYRDQDGWAEAVRARRASVDAAGFGLRVADPNNGAHHAANGAEASDGGPEGRQTGQAALRAYFHQLVTGGPTLLDLSGGRFRAGDPVVWQPGPGFIEWPDDFLVPVRQLYAGFYRDDEALMTSGLSALGLQTAAPLFRRHFGDGDQTAVQFSLEHFVSSFHNIFVHCREHGIRLQPSFLPLGIYLASLYEHLDRLGGRFDVRAAYLEAAKTVEGRADGRTGGAAPSQDRPDAPPPPP